MLWILQNSSVIKTKLIVGDLVVFLPRYDAVLVGVKVREPLFCIIQSILPVDTLDPECELLCGQKNKKTD